VFFDPPGTEGSIAARAFDYSESMNRVQESYWLTAVKYLGLYTRHSKQSSRVHVERGVRVVSPMDFLIH
jgi:hypothetical protein